MGGGFGMGMGRGGGGMGAGGGRNFSNDIYADYSGPDGSAANGNGVARAEPADPNQQIIVRNVSPLCVRMRHELICFQLPWSTSNEDLVELFETVGSVVLAEILYDGTRSKGEGVVQFTETAEAQTAGEKFTGYMYGGRPLGTHSLHSDCHTPDRLHRRPIQPSMARVYRWCRQRRSGRCSLDQLCAAQLRHHHLQRQGTERYVNVSGFYYRPNRLVE